VRIEAKVRVPCDYPAKELAADLAAEIASNTGQKRFYVFPDGLLPAYAICAPHPEGGMIFEDIIVTGRFAYRLSRRAAKGEASSEFALRIPAGFHPLSSAL
jgi:hypothetical protein